MSPAIEPPAYMPPTASMSSNIDLDDFELLMVDFDDELVEEPMDYEPLASGDVQGPDLEDEAWTDDDTGPMGF